MNDKELVELVSRNLLKSSLRKYRVYGPRYHIDESIRNVSTIEFFAIVDQYIDELVKYCFYEFFSEKNDFFPTDKPSQGNIRQLLFIAEKWKRSPIGTLEQYNKFKDQRNYYIHNILFGKDKVGVNPDAESIFSEVLIIVDFFEELLISTCDYHISIAAKYKINDKDLSLRHKDQCLYREVEKLVLPMEIINVKFNFLFNIVIAEKYREEMGKDLDLDIIEDKEKYFERIRTKYLSLVDTVSTRL